MRLENSESSGWTGHRCFFFCLNTNSPTVASPYHVFLEETHVFRTLRKFAISLVLEIVCESVNVETESRNFSALEACLQVYGNKTIMIHPCSNILVYVHKESQF